jgi:hypothetical protein
MDSLAATESRLLSWKAPPVVWTHFEDSTDWVAFNPSSSHVHLINEPAHRLWILASDGQARTLEDLASALTPPGEPRTDAALDLTKDTLAFMDDEGLLQPA